MMAKLRKGGDFRGCVNYVTRAKKDNPDGSPCDEWRLIDAEGVATYGGREEIIASFEDNQALNPKLRNVVGHFSLNFHANDKDKINDRVMVEIARKYMERMGIVDTPFIIVRHLDKDYPHCHLVFSRVDNHGETISDKNDFNRNRKVCLDLTKEYGLYISEGKAQTKVNKLRGNEKTRYEIFNAVNDAWNDKGIYTFEKFEDCLKAVGVLSIDVVQIRFRDFGSREKARSFRHQRLTANSVLPTSRNIFPKTRPCIRNRNSYS